MYDSLTLYYPGADLARVKAALSDSRQIFKQGTLVKTDGKLGAFNVSVIETGAVRVHGSIAEHACGTNARTPSLADVREVLAGLSQLVGVRMEHVHVWRFDVSVVVEMPRPIAKYIRFLGDLARHTRQQFSPASLAYTTRTNSLVIYDKLAHLKKRRVPIPLELQGKFLMRVELQRKKRPAALLNRGRVTAAMLCDRQFAGAALAKLLAVCRKIEKYPAPLLPRRPSLEWDTLKRMSVIFAIEKMGGPMEYYDRIREARAHGEITSQRASRLRTRVKDLYREGAFSHERPEMHEFTTNIHATITEYMTANDILPQDPLPC